MRQSVRHSIQQRLAHEPELLQGTLTFLDDRHEQDVGDLLHEGLHLLARHHGDLRQHRIEHIERGIGILAPWAHVPQPCLKVLPSKVRTEMPLHLSLQKEQLERSRWNDALSDDDIRQNLVENRCGHILPMFFRQLLGLLEIRKTVNQSVLVGPLAQLLHQVPAMMF